MSGTIVCLSLDENIGARGDDGYVPDGQATKIRLLLPVSTQGVTQEYCDRIVN
jgi:hypothetical protein